MDVVVIDVLDAWGMLLSRKWAANLGNNIQLDLSYATIPTIDNTYVKSVLFELSLGIVLAIYIKEVFAGFSPP
jgi:hypothetical protein